MRFCVRLAAGVLLLGGLGAESTRAEILSVSIRTRSQSGSGPRPGAALIEARAEESNQVVRRLAETPGAVEFDLRRHVLWTIEASAPGYWAPSVALQLTPGGRRDLTIDLVPAGVMTGSIRAERNDDAPETIIASLLSPRPTGRKLAGTDGKREPLELNCPIEKGTFRCRGPAGTWDVRLRARGFVSHYFWSLQIPRGPTPISVGELQLKRGASIVGWIEADREADLRQATLIVRPRLAGPGPALEDFARNLSLTSTADERGFFQFTGVTPGSYLLEAKHPGFAPAQFFPLTVMEGAESQLREPLLLRSAVRLVLELDPPGDPYDRPWNLRIFRQGEAPGTMEEISRPFARVNGEWRLSGLSPGSYRLWTLDSRGAIWSDQAIDLAEPEEVLEIAIEFVPVRGKLTLGGEPLEGVLWFGGEFGSPRVRMESDPKGLFEGLLPRQGDWPVTITSTEPSLRRNLRGISIKRSGQRREARVAIDLPDGRLVGDVVDEDGKPAGGATVSLDCPSRGEIPIEVITDSQGRFVLRGLAGGDAHIQAERDAARSDVQWIFLSEGAEATEVHLLLRRDRWLAGTVVGANGGVPAATIEAYGSSVDSRSARSGPDGTFSVAIPRLATSLDLVVAPPGYALRALRLAVPEEDQALRISVEQEGGTLILEGRLPRQEDAESWVFVVHNGVSLFIPQLQRWRSINGLKDEESSALSVPRVEYGDYSVCRVPLEQYTGVLRGADSSAHCSGGYLAPNGELRLRIPGEG